MNMTPSTITAGSQASRRLARAALYRNGRTAQARAERATDTADGHRILGAMQPFKGYAHEQLLQLSGLPVSQFEPALETLLRTCRVEKTQDWSGPFYSLPC